MGYVKILTDQYPQAILRHIWETSKNAEFFFLKNYPPALQKPFLKIQRGGPLDVEKKNSSNQVFIKAMLWHSVSRFQNGITLRYWKYFLKIFFQKIGKNIFDTKYLQKIFAIPKCYTILESWEQMPQHGFDKNLIRRIFFFNIQRGDPLDFQKRFLQCRGVIFQKKNSAFLEVSQICQRMAWGCWSISILT